MNRLSILATLVVFLSGCASMMGNIDPETGVVKEQRIYQPVDADSFGIKNKSIEITYEPDIESSGTEFLFKNKTNKPIKIVWDECAFIDQNGQSNKVLHSGVKLVDRNAHQPDSLIVPHGSLSDEILSTENVYFDSTLGHWSHVQICGKRSLFKHTLDDTDCKGKTFGYYITYMVGSKKKHTTVKFKYISVAPKQKKS